MEDANDPFPSRLAARVRRAGPALAGCAVVVALLAASVLPRATAGAGPAPSPGPKAMLHSEAPVWVAWIGEPHAVAAEAVPAAAAGSVPSGGARGLAGPALLGLPWRIATGVGLARDCAQRRSGLEGAIDALRVALPGAQSGLSRAFGDEVARDWHPTRADPSVAAVPDGATAVAEARRNDHPVVLEVGPLELLPSMEPDPQGRGCQAILQARVTLRAIRVDGGAVRFETVRTHRITEAGDGEALRAWAGEPARVQAALRALGERIALDVRWLL
jgi:hypothetical protein